MLERVRRPGLIALSLVAGASLLHSSIALSVAPRGPGSTLNLTLARLGAATAPGADVWAVRGAAARNWDEAEELLPEVVPGQAPDGLALIAVLVKIGRRQPRPVVTTAVTGRDLIDALGVHLAKDDVVKPPPDEALRTAERIRVIRYRHANRMVSETLPYETLIQYSKDLDEGQTELVTAGSPGTVIRTYRISYRNGREVGRVVINEHVVVAPVQAVYLTGNKAGEHGSQTGQASWYDFCRVDGDYAAHLTLPFGTVVTVRNLDNDETVTVVINDRGPYGVPGRIIDLCDSAFAQIAPLSQGVANVEISW